ncbi:MAG: hypothetical protein WDZ76_11165 [Pseudohongiellaceae bacterium]
MEVEYKILQSNTPMFAKPDKFREILEEEARAGWQLIEKLDNYKLRLQRETSHRANDQNLGFDPYRSQVGVSSTVTYTLTAVVTIAIVYIIFRALGTFS